MLWFKIELLMGVVLLILAALLGSAWILTMCFMANMHLGIFILLLLLLVWGMVLLEFD